jgi:hypothetical protein
MNEKFFDSDINQQKQKNEAISASGKKSILFL